MWNPSCSVNPIHSYLNMQVRILHNRAVKWPLLLHLSKIEKKKRRKEKKEEKS